MNTTPAIQATDLTKKFGHVIAVAGLSLAVAPGEIFGLVGPDGAGKTTTMRLLTGVMQPNCGSSKRPNSRASKRRASRRTWCSFPSGALTRG